MSSIDHHLSLGSISLDSVRCSLLEELLLRSPIHHDDPAGEYSRELPDYDYGSINVTDGEGRLGKACCDFQLLESYCCSNSGFKSAGYACSRVNFK